MKREIKFRAWNITQSLMIEDASHLLPLYNEDLPGDKVILMQFTGLKDKNGRGIYEGDIVSNGHDTGIIKWDKIHCAFRAYWIATALDDDVSWIPFKGMKYNEVIGNIYENPELLK